MKYTSIVATDNIDSMGEKFSPQALEKMIPQKGVPLLNNFQTDDVVGYVESAELIDNELYVTFEGNDLDNLYAVPGFKLSSLHYEGDICVYDSIRIMAFGVVDKPADPNITKLERINGESE